MARFGVKKLIAQAAAVAVVATGVGMSSTHASAATATQADVAKAAASASFTKTSRSYVGDAVAALRPVLTRAWSGAAAGVMARWQDGETFLRTGYNACQSYRKLQTQIAKDAQLLQRGDIQGAVWHFFVSGRSGTIGADPQVFADLTAAGIPYVIHAA